MDLLRTALLLSLVPATACTSFEVAGEPEIISALREPSLAIPDDTDVGVVDIARIDRSCLIESVQIDVEIRHPFRGDIFTELTSPTGTLLILKNTKDDDDSLDVVGTYPTTLTPLQPLDTFIGETGTGAWTLKVVDLFEEETGTLESWQVRLACTSTG